MTENDGVVSLRINSLSRDATHNSRDRRDVWVTKLSHLRHEPNPAERLEPTRADRLRRTGRCRESSADRLAQSILRLRPRPKRSGAGYLARCARVDTPRTAHTPWPPVHTFL